jgi:hypothetical protein
LCSSRFHLTGKTLRPLLILGSRAGAFRHPVGDFLSDSYLEKCWGIIHSFDEFSIRNISRVENHRANNLAQDASGYRIKRGRFHNTENLITGAGPIPQVADRPSGDFGLSGVARKVLLIDSADNEADASDWRTPITNYL